MTWLILSAALEIGFLPMGDFLMHDPPGYETVTGSFYVDMEARATAWGFLFVGGEVKTFMWKVGDSYAFDPERMLYQFNAGVTLGPAEVGWRHFCTHPVQTYVYKWTGQARWEGSYEELYLRIETP